MYKLGTRKSELALVQSRHIQSCLKALGVQCDLVQIESPGDKNLSQPLYEIETAGPGLFTKHLEQALLDRRVDLAVHSLKDLPTQQPQGLVLGAVSARENPADVLVTLKKNFDRTERFPIRRGLKVGTSSLRREAHIRYYRDDLQVLPIRGNVPTRVNAVTSGKVDAVVLAAAGLKRLALDLSAFEVYELTLDECVPAPAQGALGIEIRDDASSELKQALTKIHDKYSAFETRLERWILRELEGGCTLPLGVRVQHPRKEQGIFKISAFLGKDRVERSGKRVWLGFERFDISDEGNETLAENLADRTVRHLKEFLDRFEA